MKLSKEQTQRFQEWYLRTFFPDQGHYNDMKKAVELALSEFGLEIQDKSLEAVLNKILTRQCTNVDVNGSACACCQAHWYAATKLHKSTPQAGAELVLWLGCNECDVTFPCYEGAARCIRLEPVAIETAKEKQS